MYCPLCGAEYRPGFTMCSDCQVALVPDPPQRASADAAGNVDAGSKSFTLIWSGSDPRVHAEICEALQNRGIPARSLDTDDLLFNLSMQPAHQVYVPADFVNPAREAIKQVAAVEESLEESGPSESDALELPAEEDVSDENYYEQENERRSRNVSGQHLSPSGQDQDASVEIWSGPDADMANMITSSLYENDIPCRRDPDPSNPEVADAESVGGEIPAITIFVFPEDERRAKEIVREIIDAAPPE